MSPDQPIREQVAEWLARNDGQLNVRGDHIIALYQADSLLALIDPDGKLAEKVDPYDDSIDYEQIYSAMIEALWPFWEGHGSMPAEQAIRDLVGERDRFREALESLHRTAIKLMRSEDEDERGMGCAMAEVTRIVEDAP